MPTSEENQDTNELKQRTRMAGETQTTLSKSPSGHTENKGWVARGTPTPATTSPRLKRKDEQSRVKSIQ